MPVSPLAHRTLVKEADVAAPPADVWTAWTTPEGVRGFFAPATNIELRPGGAYEILFDGEQPAGKQGSEGCKVLSFLPGRMFSFSWNAPPEFPALRDASACWCVLELAERPDGGTHVTLTHLGWGESEEWDRLYGYFDRAWGIVMTRLARRFTDGPIAWD